MATFHAFLVSTLIIAVSGQDDCLTKCVDPLYKETPCCLNALSLLDVQATQSQGYTIECPRLNDTAKLEKKCRPYLTAKKCIDLCPDTETKLTTLGPLKSLELLCIDRFYEVKKYMPCISERCPDIQKVCVPQCGTVGSAMQIIVNLVRQATQTGVSQTADGVGKSPGLDTKTVSRVFADACSRIYCFNSCTKGLITYYCGGDAFSLNEDTYWTTLSGMVSTLINLGVKVEWPDECKSLAYALSKKL